MLKGFKKHIALFYLILFIGIKFVDLHTSTHSEYETYEDCDICEYVENTDKTYVLNVDLSLLEERIPHRFNQQLFNQYSYVFSKEYIENSLFSRPPPMV